MSTQPSMQSLMQSGRILAGKAIRLLPTKPFLYLYYYLITGERLSLKHPRTFGEKLQWLKVYGRLERYTPYVDKYAVRTYIEEKIGSQYLVPLIGVWDNFDDIPFETLPNQFVLKATHGGGYNFICPDKSKVNWAEARKLATGWLKENYYDWEREPQYQNCPPRLVVEQYLEDESGSLRDYKILCKSGVPQTVQLDTDRFTDHKSDIYYPDWRQVEYVTADTFGTRPEPLPKPANLDAMLEVATKLSADFPFVRVDLYSVGSKIYFGELTFTPGGGFVKLTPYSGSVRYGDMIDTEKYKTA